MVLEDPTLEKHGNLSRVKPQYTFETVTLPIKKTVFMFASMTPNLPLISILKGQTISTCPTQHMSASVRVLLGFVARFPMFVGFVRGNTERKPGLFYHFKLRLRDICKFTPSGPAVLNPKNSTLVSDENSW